MMTGQSVKSLRPRAICLIPQFIRSVQNRSFIRWNTIRPVSYTHLDVYKRQDVVCDTQVAKVSIVGAGMESHPGTASKMFEALYERDIDVYKRQPCCKGSCRIFATVGIKELGSCSRR